jgi:hypothetical protein
MPNPNYSVATICLVIIAFCTVIALFFGWDLDISVD